MRMDLRKTIVRAVLLALFAIGGPGAGAQARAACIYYPYYADVLVSFEDITMESKAALIRRDKEAAKDSNLQAEEKKTADKKKEKSEKEGKKTKKKSAKTADSKSMVSKDFNLDEGDMSILYRVVSMECDTGYEGSLAVISCMLNRLASAKYPDDLMDVIREDSQFTAYYDKETETYPYKDRKPSKECIAAVNDALKKGKRNIPSYIYYFRSSDYDYLQGYITYGQIGDNTYFYQDEDHE